MVGQYEERLADGGVLTVTTTSWWISYYFPGPNWRYKGTSVSVGCDELRQFMTDLQAAFSKCEELTNAFPLGGSYICSGGKGLTIRVGADKGVYMASHHNPVRSRDDLKSRLEQYEYAIQRAEDAQRQLRKLKEQEAINRKAE